MTRQMHLVGYLMAGPSWQSNGSWRHPDSDAVRATDPARYERLAKVMEAACFDALFFVDFAGIFDVHAGSFDATVRWAGQMCLLDPMQLLATIARVTKHIGLAATMSTTGTYPFHIARSFATLDHISGGQTAWNVVTSSSRTEAQNLGLAALPDKVLQYDMADEVVEACFKLWGSWDPDALQLGQPYKTWTRNARSSHSGEFGPRLSGGWSASMSADRLPSASFVIAQLPRWERFRCTRFSKSA